MKKDAVNSMINQSFINFWQDQLEGELPVFELLPKLSHPEASIQKRKKVEKTLPEDLLLWVNNYSKLEGVSPSTVFLAIFKILLYKYSGQEDLIVGVTIGNTSKKGDKSVNTYSNILPIRTQGGQELAFGAFLQYVDSKVLNAIEYLDCPFPLVAEKLGLNQTTLNNLFRVCFTYKNKVSKSGHPINQGRVIAESDGFGERELELDILQENTSCVLRFIYNPNVYATELTQQLCNHFMVLLASICKAPNMLLGAYPIITEEEKQQVLKGFNNTRFNYPKDRCVHQFFAENVKANPNQTATVFENEELSYQQLYDKCADLALFLQSYGVTPDSLVGLCLERSNEMMIGIQGILAAGGAYVPLDPDYPDDRLTYILNNSGVSIVLCQGKLKEKLKSLDKTGRRLIALDDEWEEITERVKKLRDNAVKIKNEVKPNHLAYVIYTSGSTGRPKGVMVEHKALMNRIDWMQRMYPLSHDDVVLQKTPFSFDVSVWEFVWPMMAGASVVFAKPKGHKDVLYLENLISLNAVSTLHFVPSMLHIYLGNTQKQRASVKQLFCSGEELDKKSVKKYKESFPNAILHNLYGPTEAAIDVTFFNCSKLKTPFVPIGSPISNIQIYILDQQNNPLPVGVPGELHIAGDGLARGYLGQDELTKEKFVSNPFYKGERMYKSGDVARWMEDGNIEYLGRIDTQVKIRGFRIETGEIETRLNKHPEIDHSCVVVHGQYAEKKLVAFYVSKKSKSGAIVSIPAISLKSHLLQKLPEYMVPSTFVSLEVLPVTPNGKLNRNDLALIDVEIVSADEYIAPRDETEKQLVNIWAELINIRPEKIGVNDNFFELGGHSLLIAQLISKIRDRLDVELPYNAFFDLYTIASIAEVIATVNYRSEENIDEQEFEEITL